MSSTRLSLQDCDITLSIPTPTTPTTARTECYVGETLYLHLTLTVPPSHSPDSLHTALQSFAQLQVTLGPDLSTARQCSLPVLKESPWTTTTTPRGDSASHSTIICKGVWALIRTPPTLAQPRFHVAGRQQLFVSLREIPVTHGLRNSPVWATIDKASRLFGKAAALCVSKSIMVNMPLEVSCDEMRVARCADKSFICVTARNATSDAELWIVPPYINLNASRVVVDGRAVEESGRDRKTVEEELAVDGGETGRSFPMEDRYDFVPMFASTVGVDDDISLSDLTLEGSMGLRRGSGGTGSNEDYGLFIPSFSRWARHAVPLGPREVFAFVYKVVQKGTCQRKVVESGQSSGELGDEKEGEGSRRKLKIGTCLETSVAVAWNCTGASTGDEMAAAWNSQELKREMSAGGVLATGKRGNVAVKMTTVQWQPAGLVEGVVVRFSGLSVVEVGVKNWVSISVLNQTERDIVAGSVVVQEGGAGEYGLMALRTVVGIGRVAAGGEATLQLPCVALRTGRVGLGEVEVVDRADVGHGQCVWRCKNGLEAFAVDGREVVEGDGLLM